MVLMRLAVVAGLAQLHGVVDASAMGSIKLDNMTFDKMVVAPGFNLFAKLDKAYGYGEKEEAFKELCKLALPVKDLIIGEIGVQEYGDMENNDLREKLGVTTEDMPAFFLFKGSAEARSRFTGFVDPTAKRPSTWDDDEDGEWEAPMREEVTVENLALWLRQNGVRMPSIGTIFDLDEVAHRFMKNPEDAAAVTEANRLAEEEHKDDKKATIYVKIMAKVQTNGQEYIQKELERVRRVMAGKITPEKTAELEDKVNILNVFAAKDF